MTKPKLNNLLTATLCIICLISCRSKTSHSYEKTTSAIRQEIKASLYTTEENRMDILPKLDNWIEHIKKGKVVSSKAVQDTLLAQCYTYQADVYQSYESNKIALDLYNQALKLDSSNINTHFNRASLYTNNYKDHAKANLEFTRIIDKKPGFADAYHARGLTYFRMDMNVEAIADFNKAIQLDSTKDAYSVDRAQAYRKILTGSNALDELSDLIRQYPHDVQAYTSRAYLYQAMGDISKALADYTAVIDINKRDASAYIFRANFYYSQKRFDMALADYTKAIEIEPDNLTAYAFRGVLNEEMKNFEDALADYTASLNLHETSRTYFFRGNVYMSLKDYDNAIKDYTKAIELDANNFDSYENRATAYRAIKDYDKSLADYTSVIESNPGSAPTYYNRGVLYYIMGRNDEALSDFEIVKALDIHDSLGMGKDMDEKIRSIKR